MAYQLGTTLGEAICKALGLPPEDVGRIVLDLRPGDVAVMDVTVFVQDHMGRRITDEVSRYELTPRSK